MNQVTLIALIGAAAARMSFGGCPEVPLVADFDASAFAGNYYEILRESMFMYEMGQECSTQSFTLNADGELDLYFRGDFGLMGYRGVDGYLQCDAGSADTHTCMASMAGSEPEYEFNFLAATEEYAVSYFCMDMLGDNAKVEWYNILSREETLSDSLLEEAKAKITATTGITPNWMNTHTTRQGGNCEYDWTL